MSWKGRRVLVTGAGGFIGSHLVERLLSMDARVTAFVKYNSRNNYGCIEMFPDGIKKKINIISGNICEFESISKAMAGQEVVFHLAALVGIPYSYIHPQEVVATNTMDTLNVLLAAKDKNINRVVITSTSEVYGTALYVPIDEKHPLQGQSPYSASKIAADKLAESFYKSFNMPISIVRPFNSYGIRQSLRAVIPTIIAQALKTNEVLLGNTATKRDFTYVTDTVEGFIKIASSAKTIGEVINVGSGYEISIREVVEKVGRILNKNIKIKSDKKRIRPEKSEVRRLLADNTKARKLVGWRPQISIEEGLVKTIDWMKSQISKVKSGEYNL